MTIAFYYLVIFLLLYCVFLNHKIMTLISCIVVLEDKINFLDKKFYSKVVAVKSKIEEIDKK